MYLHDVMSSVYDKVINNQPICNVLEKVISSVYSSSFKIGTLSRYTYSSKNFSRKT